MTSQVDTPTRSSSLKQLLLVFAAWKTLIWCIAYFSPGIGYDTSSDLLLHSGGHPNDIQDVPSRIGHNLFKFVRWDAIYFTEIARRGHVFEQEWAFGKGLSTVLAFTTHALGIQGDSATADHALVGIFVSHLSHWLSVVLLFAIANMLQHPSPLSPSTSFAAAVLHILSPAGIFLSAPYSESLFSFLNMLGFYLYIKSIYGCVGATTWTGLIYKLFSGIAFGCATLIRSNGILSGIPSLVDAVEVILHLFNPYTDRFSKSGLLLQLQFTIVAGCCVAAGMLFPQFLAYRAYCSGGLEDRQWCKAIPPSIFTFVQSHYWNVGFLRYWTLSNTPLFFLAIPCLYLTSVSAWQEVRSALSSNPTFLQKLCLRVALPQLVLSSLALTNYHVQIITRLSSGYPLWYFWMATRITDSRLSDIHIRTLVIYGLVQAGLFASFLPPA